MRMSSPNLDEVFALPSNQSEHTARPYLHPPEYNALTEHFCRHVVTLPRKTRLVLFDGVIQEYIYGGTREDKFAEVKWPHGPTVLKTNPKNAVRYLRNEPI